MRMISIAGDSVKTQSAGRFKTLADRHAALRPLYRTGREAKHRLRFLMGSNHVACRLYARLLEPRLLPFLVTPDTDLVIEGFGGSANSFAERAFKRAQDRPYRVAHHVHTPSQIFNAVRWNLPTILLIRDPVDVAVSLVSRDFYPSLRLVLRHYTRFYRRVMPLKNKVVIADFNEVIGNFGEVLKRVNERYGTSFSPFEHTPENVENIFESIPKSSEDKPAPTQERQRVKDTVRSQADAPGLAPIREQAQAVYREFTA